MLESGTEHLLLHKIKAIQSHWLASRKKMVHLPKGAAVLSLPVVPQVVTIWKDSYCATKRCVFFPPQMIRFVLGIRLLKNKNLVAYSFSASVKQPDYKITLVPDSTKANST